MTKPRITVLNYHSSPFYYKIAVHFTLLPELNAQFFHRFHIGILDKYEIFTRNLYILMTLVVSGGHVKARMGYWVDTERVSLEGQIGQNVVRVNYKTQGQLGYPFLKMLCGSSRLDNCKVPGWYSSPKHMSNSISSNYILESSQNKKDHNDVTAALFLVFFFAADS